MPTAFFRFYGDLNDFLPRTRRQAELRHRFAGRASVKDRIEALGVPHPEVELILVGGQPAGFETLLRDGDRVSVFPAFTSLDLPPHTRLRPPPAGEPRFALDAHLGALARALRLLGFDALYRNDYADEELVRLAGADERILLTRDRGLLKRRAVTRGYWVRSRQPRRQAQEVARRFGLRPRAAPFTRCTRCNGRLAAVDKAEVAERLPYYTRLYYDEFYRCADCGRAYWAGAHSAGLRAFVAEVLGLDGSPDGAE